MTRDTYCTHNPNTHLDIQYYDLNLFTEVFKLDHSHILHNQSQATEGTTSERSLFPFIYPGIFPSIQAVSIAATWNGMKASLPQSSSVIGFVVLSARLFLPPPPPTLHATAVDLFLVQSLKILAKGTSNHNCKLIVCPRRWLQHHSHPRLNTSLSSVIAAIVVHSTTKGQL